MNATRSAVRVFSLLGFCGYFVFFMVIGAASGLSDVSSSVNVRTIALLASPIIYFGYCFISSFGRWQRTPLLITGIVAHLCIIPFVVRLISDGGWIFDFPIAIMAVCWASMFFELERKDGI
jgi:hypothetical protein